jgi:hypothetical protein
MPGLRPGYPGLTVPGIESHWNYGDKLRPNRLVNSQAMTVLVDERPAALPS